MSSIGVLANATHHSRHASGGADALTPAMIGALPANDLSAFGVFLPEHYGVTGTADDRAFIQAANDAAKAAGGGRVYLSRMYVTSPLVQSANVVFEGAGRAFTGLQLKAGSNADLLVTEGFATNTNTTNNGPSGFGLRRLTLDGNRANQTALARCYVVYGYNYNVDDVYMVGGWGGGFYSEWNGTAAVEEAFIDGLKVSDYGGTPGSVGIDWNGPHDTQWGEVVVTTLDSTIRPTDVAYGATPINGNTVSFPGGATTFTFVTSAAAPTSLFPATGGSFVVASTNSLPTWVYVTYTSAATVGSVTTFSGCVAANSFASWQVPASGGIVQPTYGVRINGGTGAHGEAALQVDRLHVWGRNHFGIIVMSSTGCSFFISNGECEGAFLSNVNLTSHSIYRGAVFGTNGQAGQTNESGIQLGSNLNGCGQAQVDATVYNIGGASSLNGCSVQTVSSSGFNQVKVAGQTSHPTKYVNAYTGSADNWEASCSNALFSVYQYAFNMTYPVLASTYGTTVSVNPNVAKWIPVTVTNATNFVVALTGVVSGAHTVEFTIEIFNNSGGAMGTITWPGTTVFPNGAWVNPANGKKRYATFMYQATGSTLVCTSMAANDY